MNWALSYPHAVHVNRPSKTITIRPSAPTDNSFTITSGRGSTGPLIPGILPAHPLARNAVRSAPTKEFVDNNRTTHTM